MIAKKSSNPSSKLFRLCLGYLASYPVTESAPVCEFGFPCRPNS